MVNPTHPRYPSSAPTQIAASGGQIVTLALAWLGVGLPLAWGVLETLRKALALFE